MPRKTKVRVVSRKHQARLEKERRQTRIIVIATIVIAVLVVGVIGYGILYNAVLAGFQPVARVGSEVITIRQWQERVRYQRFTLINQYDQEYQVATIFGMDPSTDPTLSQIQSELNNSNTLASNTLDQMINEIVTRNEANKLGISVSPQEITDGMQSAFFYYPKGTPTPTVAPTPWLGPTLNATQFAMVSPTPTETSIPSATPTQTPAVTETPTLPTASTPTPVPSLTPTETILTTITPYTTAGYQRNINQFLSKAAAQGVPGLDSSFLHQITQEQLYATKVLEYLTKDVSDTQDQVWARHILTPDQTSALAASASLKAGADWTTLSTKISLDSTTSSTGGDLGWFPKGIQDPATDQAAFALQVGQISDPVKTQNGWEIIQVLGHAVRPVDSTTLQQLKAQIFQTWVDNAVKKTAITKYDNIWKNNVPVAPTLNPGGPAALGG
jgi:peptidyl-prolyl cis-trans isomerase D